MDRFVEDVIEKKMVGRADQRVLKWFGHAERMDEYRMMC